MARYDSLIKGGLVVDGTGMPGMVTDVAIRDGVVARVDGIPASQAKEVIDAKGLIVAPGFVDLHTHYDAQIFWDPYCTLSGWHGVTSVVIGNCGFGLAPCKPKERERLMLSLTRNEQISLEAMQCAGVSDGGGAYEDVRGRLLYYGLPDLDGARNGCAAFGRSASRVVRVTRANGGAEESRDASRRTTG